MSKKNETKPLKQSVDNNSASPEPDFRIHPESWIGWNMRVYKNDYETAKKLLCQRVWLMSF